MARNLTVDEFNKEFSRCAVADIMDTNRYFVILPNNQGVLIYKTEAEAGQSNINDKVQREIIYIKRG